MNARRTRARHAAARSTWGRLLVVMVAVVGGCTVGVVPRSRIPGPYEGVPDSLGTVRQPRAHGRRPSYEVSEKRVGAKEEPSTLVADDGTRCTVTKDRFRKVGVGEWATCAWRSDDRGS